MSAHILGIPIEESVLPLLPVAAAITTALAIAARTQLSRFGRRRRSSRK